MIDQEEPESTPETTENRILKAALHEFSNYGLAGARVDRIADQARVNKAMIYYHFRSKEQLYRSVVEDHFERAAKGFTMRASPVLDLRGLLKALGEVYAEIADDRAEIFPILLRELAESDSEIVPKAAQFISSTGLPDRILGEIEAGKGKNELRDIDSKQAFCSFIAMNIGYLVLAPLLHRMLNIENPAKFALERPAAVMDLFTNGVMKK